MTKDSSTTPLQIPLTISTEIDTTKDKYPTDAIDHISYQLDTIFFCIQQLARGEDLLDIQTDSQLMDYSTYRYHAQNLSRIGMGLSEELTILTGKINNAKLRRCSDTPVGDGNLAGDGKPSSLAQNLSAVLRDEQLPEPLYNSIERAVAEFFNEYIDQNAAIAVQNSPEYIDAILTGFPKEGRN